MWFFLDFGLRHGVYYNLEHCSQSCLSLFVLCQAEFLCALATLNNYKIPMPRCFFPFEIGAIPLAAIVSLKHHFSSRFPFFVYTHFSPRTTTHTHTHTHTHAHLWLWLRLLNFIYHPLCSFVFGLKRGKRKEQRTMMFSPAQSSQHQSNLAAAFVYWEPPH